MNLKRLALALTVVVVTTGLLALLGLLGHAGSAAVASTRTLAPAVPDTAPSSNTDNTSIRYVAVTGGDSGDCSTPGGACRTVQYAVDQAGEGGQVRVAGGVYTGVNHYGGLAQVVYLSKTVTIQGGYSTGDWAKSDPEAHPTTLDAERQGRVIYVTGSVSPTIAGLRITGGDAAGLGGAPQPSDNDAGGGVFIHSASAVLQGNQVLSNTARFGGGVFLLESSSTLRENTFAGNTAYFGGGGCVYANDRPAMFTGNVFSRNTGNVGGGLTLWMGQATISGNTFAGNVADYCGGLEAFASGAALDANTFSENSARALWGGGLCLRFGEDATLSANRITGNSAEGQGGGVYLDQNNASLVNNVLADNTASFSGAAVYAEAAEARLLHTTLARNTGGNGSAVYVTGDESGGSSVALTNTILVSHSVGIAVTGGSTVTLNGVLWYATPFTVSRSVTAVVSLQNERAGAPAFGPDGYHLTPASAALDAGVNAGVTQDIDGHARFYSAAPDLGADELTAVSLAPGVASTLAYTDPQGSPTSLELPAGAVAEPLLLVYTPLETVTVPAELSFAAHAFGADVYRGGTRLSPFVFGAPVIVTVHYTRADVAGLDEKTLELRYWDGAAWVDGASTCAPAYAYVHNPRQNWFSLSVCRAGRFAVFGQAADYTAFLPIVLRALPEEPEPPPPPPPPPETPPAGFALWRGADGGFDDWARDGVGLTDEGELKLDLAAARWASDPYPPGGYYGHDFYNGSQFWVGEASSPVVSASFSLEEAVASWNADTPAGTWLETLARVQLGDRWTKWYNMGVWAAGTATIERHSVSQQADTDGYVAVDTLVVTNQGAPVNAYQLKLRLFSEDAVGVPSVRSTAFAFSEALGTTGLPPGNPALWDQVLAVPECSQMVYPDGGTVWCSPTSTAMVLKYWEGDAGPCEPDVRAAVAGVYDWLYDGHGNWPFNTAYAATQGLEAYVARFNNLAQAEPWIAADVPVVFSLAWGYGELPGAPLPVSDGHLLVLVGFDADGDPVVNDPAAATDDAVRRTYDRAALERLWLEHTDGTVYLIYPPGWAVPDL